MSIKFNRSQTFATNGVVTAAGLHNLVDGLDIYQALITDQTSLAAVAPEDSILIADASLTAGDAPRQTTVQNLFDDGLSSGTYTSLNLSGALTYGTATGNRTVSTSATITTGTIPNLTAGTTTGTLATLTNANITNGTIQTLTSSTATITGGTFSGSVNSTAGTIATLNSTTGTIGNLSTTLAGDLTISQGTATLGTSGVTASSYGTTSDIPRITVDAKGRITSASTVTAPVGFRNRIINGDMRIDQRNAGASVTISNVFHTDRWQAYEDSDGVMTAQRDSSAPSGFTNSLKITTTTADASLSSLQYACLLQSLEGYNVSDFAFGTASAKTITISFWVRSSLTGTFGGVVKNTGTGTRSYPFTYSISSADTWENKTITIAGDTTGTWASDNSCGMQIVFGLGVGSTYSGTAGAWAGSNLLSATGAVSVLGTLNATWYITGVQLEVGTTATDFERRPIGTELALCQRYYWTGNLPIMRNFTGATIAVSSSIGLPVTMRTTPSTVTVASGTLETAYSSTISAFSFGITSGQTYTPGTATASSEL